MLSDGPPSRELITTSRTCRLPVDVNALTSSGITAPASVPHATIVAKTHQWLAVGPVPRTRYVVA